MNINLSVGNTPEIEKNGRGDRLARWLLFVGLSSIYFATLSGITSSNGGSHYALLRTIVDNQTFALENFDDYAEGNDIAIVNDELYSDRPPGNAVTAVPFYLLAGSLPDPITPLPSRHDADNPRLMWLLLLPVLAGTGTALLVYTLLRRCRVSLPAAFLATVFFALGTVHWKYSTVFFSHALSSLLVLGSVTLALWLGKRPSRHWGWFALLGFLLGWSVVVEYSNGLLVIVVALFVLLARRKDPMTQLLRQMGALVLAGLVAAAFLAYYNNTNFGSPFTLSYAFATNYPWAAEFGSTFSYPLGAGLRALLWWGEADGWCGGVCTNQGIFLLSPVLLLALPGLWRYGRGYPREFALTMSLFLIYTLLFAQHRTLHGFTHDSRYLLPYLGLLALPLGFTLDWVLAWKRPLLYTVALLLLFGLFYLSLRNVALHIATSFNYTLDLTQFQPQLASPQNWQLLIAALFPNRGNLPLWWGLVAIGTLGTSLWHWRKPNPQRNQQN